MIPSRKSAKVQQAKHGCTREVFTAPSLAQVMLQGQGGRRTWQPTLDKQRSAPVILFLLPFFSLPLVPSDTDEPPGWSAEGIGQTRQDAPPASLAEIESKEVERCGRSDMALLSKFACTSDLSSPTSKIRW